MTEISQNLLDFLKEIANEEGYVSENIDIEAISTEGANYTSDLFIATISAPKKENLKLFAKVSNVSESLKATTNIFNLIFKKEKSFYSELAVAFNNLYNKSDVPAEERLYIAKFYGYKNTEMEEIMVLENLAAKGFRNFDRLKTIDWEYASKSVEELAKFHALGLALREENVEEFERICSSVIIDVFSDENLKRPLLEQAVKMGTEVIKEEYRDRMHKFFKSNNLLDGLEKLWSPSDTGFLIHGDLNTHNQMHRRRNGKLEVVPLDYQTFHKGNLAADLMNFIWMGSDAQFRKSHYKELVEHYYTQLTRALKNLRVDVNTIYPRKVFEQELNETRTLGLFIGLAMMNTLTADPKDVPKLETFDSFAMEPNQRAKDRMNGVVEDYARWGII